MPHGGGPMPLTGDPSHTGLTSWLMKAATLLPQKPTSILCISGHWEEKQPTLTASAAPPLLFDYYGFPEEVCPACMHIECASAVQVSRQHQSHTRSASSAASVGGYTCLLCHELGLLLAVQPLFACAELELLPTQLYLWQEAAACRVPWPVPYSVFCLLDLLPASFLLPLCPAALQRKVLLPLCSGFASQHVAAACRHTSMSTRPQGRPSWCRGCLSC